MQKEVINPEEIIAKAREVMLNGKFIGEFSELEEKWLEEHNRPLYAVYKMSTEAKKKGLETKRRGKDYER